MSLSPPSFFLATLAAMVLLGGCRSSQPDYTPFAEGMKAIAIALVVVAVVGALADLVKADDQRKNPPPSEPRKTRRNKSKGGEP